MAITRSIQNLVRIVSRTLQKLLRDSGLVLVRQNVHVWRHPSGHKLHHRENSVRTDSRKTTFEQASKDFCVRKEQRRERDRGSSPVKQRRFLVSW
jgi:hypothetical protein